MIGVKYKAIPTNEIEVHDVKSTSSNHNIAREETQSDQSYKRPRQRSMQSSLPKPLFIQKSKPYGPVTMQFKTTDSTESQNRNTGTGTDSDRSYMRHTSTSENRHKNKNKTLIVKSSQNRKNVTQHVKTDSNEQVIKSLAATYMNFNNSKSVSKERNSYSPAPNNQEEDETPTKQKDIERLIKRLNKPEMLLLNHLQNQMKQYYPPKMNKHLPIQSRYEQTQPNKFMEAVEKQRKIIGDQPINIVNQTAQPKLQQTKTVSIQQLLNKSGRSVSKEVKPEIVSQQIIMNTNRRKKLKVPEKEPVKKSTYVQVLERMQATLKPISHTRNSKLNQTKTTNNESLKANDSMPIISAQQQTTFFF